MVITKKFQHRNNSGRSMKRRVLATFLMLAAATSPAVVRADANETSPTNPNAASSALLTVGDYNVCYVLSSSKVKCWGYNNGNVGDGTTDDAKVPKDVIGLTGVKAITGTQTKCALTTSGGLKCWGPARVNGLANGTTLAADHPGLTSGVKMVSAGAGQGCAVLTSTELKCWGLNNFGQLGDGTTTDNLTPVQVSGFATGAASVTVGGQHVCALTTSGGVQCWGRGDQGQVGDNSNSSSPRLTPTQVTGLTSGVVAISAGDEFACALLSTGAVQCWGRGDAGQIGNGASTNALVPTQVSGLTSGVVAISAGTSHACALMSTGAVKCWGSNNEGQLGNGAQVDSNVPVDVIGLGVNVKAVSAGESFTCVLIAVGDLRCWGANYYGNLGNGTETDSVTPVRVLGLAAPATTTTKPDTSDTSGLPGTGAGSNSVLLVALAMLSSGAMVLLGRRVGRPRS